MKKYVLDTSVAIAWYLPEKFSEAAREWQRRLLAEDALLLVPSLHYWEFANVLRTYVRRGELSTDVAQETFEVHLDAPLHPREPDRRAALTRALEFQATVYDAVYIELALSEDAVLLTAERTTTPWVVKLGRSALPIRG
jgi:predicted nucleic acid-binding protein